MGLTARSTGRNAVEGHFAVKKEKESDTVIALGGNPNVGKSTVFNELTGMNQHTGNWPGKTVANAQGTHTYQGQDYILVDLPGTYSLMAHSTEEEIARDFLLFGGADAAVIVCDATCLERNLNLVLQTMEITSNVVVCVNLMDEAKKKGIEIDIPVLEEQLGVPVVGTSARSGKGLKELMKRVRQVTTGEYTPKPRAVRYPQALEKAIAVLEPVLNQELGDSLNNRWLSVRLMDQDPTLLSGIREHLQCDLLENNVVVKALDEAKYILDQAHIQEEVFQDRVVSCIVLAAEEVCMETVPCARCVANDRDRKLDKLLTSRLTGIPIMLLLLCVVFWITITGSNLPSEILADGLFWVQDRLTDFFVWAGVPMVLHDILVLGVYRVLAWVVSVMLPPMAIFFPLFTLLEDFGYLPRVAFNLDHQFSKAKACGKQALTMCMGFGCNAAGVVGCRIIDSPRERLIAILTNNFVPCNGRFPTLIAIISMFFVGSFTGVFDTAISTLILAGTIVLGVLLTFLISRFLSETLLRGEPSSFTLELPPYRTPQIGRVLVRSLLDRTLFVLGRAVSVAAPAGLVIWVMANITVGDMSILAHCSGFLDPFAKLLGMDGVILLAFILGFPANEIVVPIIIMAYMSTNTILEMDSLTELKELLVANGWTWVTAVSTMLFCLIHWPCSTTCLTIKKETGSWKWTGLSILLPTIVGILVCFVFTIVVRGLGLV